MACPDCFTGYIRTDAEPAGTVSKVYGLPTYIPPASTTTPNGQSKGVIVIIADAFGWKFVNNRLLADAYASTGYRVYLPDFMNGASAPAYFLSSVDRLRSTSSLSDWLYKPYDLFWLVCGMVPFLWTNMIPTSHPRVVGFMEQLKSAPVAEDKGLKVGVAGFCWGGKHAFLLTHASEAHLVDAVFTGHPSWLKLPDDAQNVRKPVSVAIGDKDMYLPLGQAQEIEKIFKKLEEDVGGLKCEVVVYQDAAHGFTSRLDIKNSKQVEQSNQAAKQATTWFERMLA